MQTSMDGEHTIERYLADQLSENEAEAFERRCAEDPRFYRDIEARLRLKEGLAVLRDRGTLDAALHGPREGRWVLRVAAGVILALLCAGVWRQIELPSVSSPGPMLTAVLGSTPGSLPVTATYRLERSRGAPPAISLASSQAPGAIELQILPSNFDPSGHYDVELSQLDPGPAARPFGELRGLSPAADRYVTVYLNRVRLAPGRYELSLRPEHGTGNGRDEVDQFSVRLR